MISKLAKYEHVARIDDGPRDTSFRAALLHTAGTGASDLYSWWSSGAPPGVGAHFYINEQGTIYQYLDTDRYTGHAWDANHWSVGIETWDGGTPISHPWNQAQLDSIDALLRDLGIPGQALKCAPSNGVGYHQQCPAWNQSGHDCPGPTRLKQVPGIIARLKSGTSGGGGDDLTKTESAMLAALWEDLKYRAANAGVTNVPPTEADAADPKYKGWVKAYDLIANPPKP